jgi:chaperonin GroES
VADRNRNAGASSDADLPIRKLHDRVLLSQDGETGERQTGNGLLIPATASLGKRLHWATVRASGTCTPSTPGDRSRRNPGSTPRLRVQCCPLV